MDASTTVVRNAKDAALAPAEAYYSRQYKMEEAYWELLAAIAKARVDGRPSGLADFDSSIWERFAEALSEVGLAI